MELPQKNTSTPVDSRRETRVRFAPYIDTADDRVSVNTSANGHDLSAALQDLSALSSEVTFSLCGVIFLGDFALWLDLGRFECGVEVYCTLGEQFLWSYCIFI